MAKIVIINSGLSGILNISIAAAKRLQVDGHNVTISTCLDKGEIVRNAGFKFIQGPNLYLPYEKPIPKSFSFIKKLLIFCQRYLNLSSRKKRCEEVLETERGISYLDNHHFDLFIIDIELHEFILTAIKAKKSYRIISPWFDLQEDELVPPITTLHQPGSISFSELYTKEQKSFKKQAKGSLYRNALIDRRSTLLRFIQKNNLEVDLQDGGWPPPFTYKNQQVISANVKSLDFPRVKPTSLEYVGPLINTTNKEEISDLVLQRVIEEEKLGKPIVYCALSTMNEIGDDPLIKVIKATKSLTHINLVIGMGGRLKNYDLPPLEDHQIAIDWVPQLSLLPYASLVINHGGINTVNEALVHGVPLLILPGNKHDQNGIAARAAYHGFAKLHLTTDSISELGEKIVDLLSDEVIKEKVFHLQKALEQIRRDQKFEQVINKALNEKI